MDNPILMLIEGNGSLEGRDRSGAFTATGSGALRYAAAPGARTNYFPNPSFESATTAPLLGNFATISQSADFALNGTNALKVTCTATGAEAGAYISSGNMTIVNQLPVYFGDVTVSVSWYVFHQLAGPKDFQARIAGNNGATIAVPPNTWTRVSHSRALSAGDTLAAHFGRMLNATSGDVWYVDCVQVEIAPSPTAWIGGGIGGAVWLDPLTGQLGTAHASPSVSRAQFWVEEATTNLIGNPRAETSATGWLTAATDGSLSGARDTTKAYIGSASYKVTATANCVGSVSQQLASLPAISPSAGSFTQSWYVFIPTAFSATEIELRFANYTSASEGTKVVVDLTKRDQWQRVARTATLDAGDLSGQISLRLTAGTMLSGESIWVTCVQAEAKAYATSYCDGSIGTGYTWAGTAHASASTRAVGYATVAVTADDRIDTVKGTMAARFALDYSSGGNQIIVHHGTFSGADDSVGVEKHQGSSVIRGLVRRGGANIAATAGAIPSANVSTIAVIDWDASALGAALNGGSRTQVAATGATGTPGTAFIYLGVYGSGLTASLDGFIGPVAIYARLLDDVERGLVNDAIDNDDDLWELLEPPPEPDMSSRFMGFHSSKMARHSTAVMGSVPKPDDWRVRS